MWTDEQRRRYETLCEFEQTGQLTGEQATELAALVQQVSDEAAKHLAPADQRKADEIAAMTTAANRLETENRRLREYLGERRAFQSGLTSISSPLH
jgi:hypothetical protein